MLKLKTLVMINKTLLLIIFTFSIFACTRHSIITRSGLIAIRPLHKYNSSDSSKSANYKDTTSWLVYDNKGMNVDVFFVHPTTYLSSNSWNAPINDRKIMDRTHEWSIKRQLSIFDNYGNIFAPQYRQATFYAFVSKSKDGEKARNLATQDIRKAWNHFLKNINKTNPIIIAGHSQGSMIIMRLLPEIMADTDLAKRIIVVYTIGWPLGEKYLQENPQIKVCTDSLQTSCVISYNSEGKHASGTIIDRPSVSVNPLNWSTSDDFVSKSFHKGAVFYRFNGEVDTIPNCVNAQNKKGHLIVTDLPSNMKINPQTPNGIYHPIDYNIFYINIQENLESRIKAYWLINKSQK